MGGGERLRVPGLVKGANRRPAGGLAAFHNCIGRRRGRGGDTSAKAADIIIRGANPWATPIKNAYWQA